MIAVSRGYDLYCAADPLYYDTLGNSGTSHDFETAARAAPPGWVRGSNDEWVAYGPRPSGLPEQGWKIHVSGRVDNAERLLGTVWDYCVAQRLSLKFLRSAEVLFMRNAKYAFRGGSGKLATIYPRDEDEAALACKELDDLLGGEPGPYILSDLRFGDGPLYLRYGGFAGLTCPDAQGRRVPAIRDPSGRLVPDVRGPVFAPPEWVRLPDFLVPHMAARNAVTVADLPYEITEALHHSNGGGVYLGRNRRTGERVVLKEARPHAGLAAGGSDAVQRLRRERDMLKRLSGIDAVPRLLDYLTVGEHEFLVEEFIEGTPLNKAVSARHPLLGNTLSEAAVADHAAWATRIHAAVTRAVGAIHRRGVVYGDLHMFNVIVRPDDERIALVDFEVATDADGGERPGLGAAGFAAPRELTGPRRSSTAPHRHATTGSSRATSPSSRWVGSISHTAPRESCGRWRSRARAGPNNTRNGCSRGSARPPAAGFTTACTASPMPWNTSAISARRCNCLTALSTEVGRTRVSTCSVGSPVSGSTAPTSPTGPATPVSRRPPRKRRASSRIASAGSTMWHRSAAANIPMRG